MKGKFTTVDIITSVHEINNSELIGLRIANIYDVDQKTYLIKLSKPDFKATILIESGVRIHMTEFEWPKNFTPSGFSMKMRKHLRDRRLEEVRQLGIDRIVDLKFGSNEAAYHVIVELYDRGNIILTDYEYTILNLLRTRTDDSEDVRFAVRETYPCDLAKQRQPMMNKEQLMKILQDAKEGDNIKRILNPHLAYGPAIIDHCLLSAGFKKDIQLNKGFTAEQDLHKLLLSLQDAESFLDMKMKSSNGYIIQKAEKKVNIDQQGQDSDQVLMYQEFHPYLYKQHEDQLYIELPSFNKAVDEFFSKLQSQKIDSKSLQQEKSALKKLDNIKKDHEKRILTLQETQESNYRMGELIELNLDLVDNAIKVICSAIANQMDWAEINEIIRDAKLQGDPVASAVKGLKLDVNHLVLQLTDPYLNSSSESDTDSSEEDEERKKSKKKKKTNKLVKVEIDLGLSAYSNARQYYDMRRHAAAKQDKTISASEKALKSAERKTKQTLKEVATTATINKARKIYWFEKFLWFVSSENYLVIGGRDSQQNELIVKRYLNLGDIYVHADLHGACSVIIKNQSGQPVPPKTLNEAGTMAICHSAAWEAKVVTSAWWVHHDQVSKTAPTGEYLTTGAFMIRGKKKYLPPSYLIMGFGFLLKLDETCIERHADDRKVKQSEEDYTYITHDEPVEHIPTCTAEVQQQSDEDSKSDDGEVHYPDTNIQMSHVTGDRYQLNQAGGDDGDDAVVDLGDGTVIHLNKQHTDDSHSAGTKQAQRLTAKQKREIRKQRLQSVTEDEPGGSKNECATATSSCSSVTGQSKEESLPTKRGQKSKMKKIREKYADQDDEERELRMQILASSGSQKASKKDRKKEAQALKDRPRSKQGQRPHTANKSNSNSNKTVHTEAGQQGTITVPSPQSTLNQPQSEIKTENNIEPHSQTVVGEKTETLKTEDTPVETQPDPVSDDDNVEDGADSSKEQMAIVDSLTGCPLEDDILLYAIPVCAPYNAMLNYKFRVKVTPGSAKRGKSARNVLQMFIRDKQASQRERDLLKSVKDVDLSRGLPGKVKISAPHLSKK